ncbi:MAG: DNA polymerase III subunit beta [Lachnospiraceae bacterium]|nr:DNA polymerase III subunit beta [Lachnospiraceae bacterium]MCI9470367.1 DNA polymerase III subunit beta [Lachnospiraceae bacterium]
MKIICSKTDLSKSINISLKAVPNKTTMPILECILVDASANQIKFVSNDMELGIETIVEGTIEERGIIALDAKIFSEIIRKLPDSQVTIQTDDSQNVTITCEKAKFNIPGKPGEDFTYLPVIEKDESLTISQFTLKEMIRQTIFSIAVNENNKMMTGELFEIKNGILKIVSLDGHRISIRNVQLKKQYQDKKVIVPGKTLSEISKILSGEVDDQVSIFFGQNHILFEFDKTMVVSRLIEGEYFKIDQMLSSDHETMVSINRKEFLDCIDRASLFIRESDKRPIIIQITEGSMELKINSAMGSMDEQIDIEKEGKDILIGFNPKFLMDALKVIDDEVIHIYLVNPKAPCFIRDEERQYTYLILPVNFNQIG